MSFADNCSPAAVTIATRTCPAHKTSSDVSSCCNQINLKKRIADGIRVLNHDQVKETFIKYSTATKSSSIAQAGADSWMDRKLGKSKFLLAMKSLGIPPLERPNLSNHSAGDELAVDLIFQDLDIDSDGGLNFSEFQRVAEYTNSFEQFVRTIPLWKILALAIPHPKHYCETTSKELLDTMSLLSLDDICNIVDAMRDEMITMISMHIKELRRTQEAMKKKEATVASGKFTCFEMKAGGIDDFHEGLKERVGMKYLLEENPLNFNSKFYFSRFTGAPDLKFTEAMKAEHCTKKGWDTKFTSSNYSIVTFPKKEWEIVVDYRIDLMTKDDLRQDRTIKKISELEALDLVKTTHLQIPEIIAVVLYTGPMVSNCLVCFIAARTLCHSTDISLYYLSVYCLQLRPSRISKRSV